MIPVAVDPSGRFGLDSHLAGVLADQGYRAEMASQKPEDQGEFPRLPSSLIALARDSFATDPLEVSSLRTVAIGNILQDDEGRARRVMRLAERISKRDSITSLWLAQDYLRTGDIEAMLTSFDHALRTSSRVREVAMKPVVDSLASEDSFAPLGKLLAARPEWEADFWKEFAHNPVGQAQAVGFLKSNGVPLARLPQDDLDVLYTNLKRTRRYDVLFGLAELDPELDTESKALAAGKFITAKDSPLGWTTHSEGSFAARVQGSAGELQIDAHSGSFGLAADRVVAGGGSWRLIIRMAEPVPDESELELTVRCVDGNVRELTRLRLASGDRSGEAVVSIEDCRFASLNLFFAVQPGSRDAFIRVAAVELQGA